MRTSRMQNNFGIVILNNFHESVFKKRTVSVAKGGSELRSES